MLCYDALSLPSTSRTDHVIFIKLLSNVMQLCVIMTTGSCSRHNNYPRLAKLRRSYFCSSYQHPSEKMFFTGQEYHQPTAGEPPSEQAYSLYLAQPKCHYVMPTYASIIFYTKTHCIVAIKLQHVISCQSASV